MENFAKKSSPAKGLAVVAEAEDALVSCLLQSTDGPRSRRTMGGKHYGCTDLTHLSVMARLFLDSSHDSLGLIVR